MRLKGVADVERKSAATLSSIMHEDKTYILTRLSAPRPITPNTNLKSGWTGEEVPILDQRPSPLKPPPRKWRNAQSPV